MQTVVNFYTATAVEWLKCVTTVCAGSHPLKITLDLRVFTETGPYSLRYIPHIHCTTLLYRSVLWLLLWNKVFTTKTVAAAWSKIGELWCGILLLADFQSEEQPNCKENMRIVCFENSGHCTENNRRISAGCKVIHSVAWIGFHWQNRASFNKSELALTKAKSELAVILAWFACMTGLYFVIVLFTVVQVMYVLGLGLCSGMIAVALFSKTLESSSDLTSVMILRQS